MNFPPIPADLLKVLEEMLPERCPELTWTDREVWSSVGERRVIRLLKAKFDEQSSHVLGIKSAD